MARAALNQNVRGAMDIIGSEIRIAGENLPRFFPVVEIEDDLYGVGADRIAVHRAIISDALSLCSTVGPGVPEPTLEVANDSLLAGCDVAGNTAISNEFVSYRTGAAGRSMRVFLVDISSGEGQFFNFIGENSSPTSLQLVLDSPNWERVYTQGASAIYLVDSNEFFRDENDRLVRYQNGDESDPQTVSFDISRFDVVAFDAEENILTDFTSGNSWTDIKFIEVTVGAAGSHAGRQLSREVTGRYFPRNILSH